MNYIARKGTPIEVNLRKIRAPPFLMGWRLLCAVLRQKNKETENKKTCLYLIKFPLIFTTQRTS